MNPNHYDGLISMFAGAPGHSSAMRNNGRVLKVGIGIAQDPVTGTTTTASSTSLIASGSGGDG